MARGINKVILIGNLGNDPDTRYTGEGAAITNLSVATDESYKDKNTGQMVPKTEWHRVVMFNRLAEIAKEYLRKGSKVYIEGRLQTRKWQDQGGQDRYTTEIVANEMQMLDSQQQGQAPQQNQQQRPQQAPQQQRPQHAGNGQSQQQQPQGMPQNQGYAPAYDDQLEDDIPFNQGAR